MLSELLLILAGHPSAFLTEYPSPPSVSTTLKVSQTLSEYLHPGEICSLNTLGQLAFRYRTIRTWALDIQRRSRATIQRSASISSRKGKQRELEVDGPDHIPSVYSSTLASGVLDILKEYEILVVTTETRVLSLDPGLVQDEETGYVPLSSLIATFDPWQIPLASLSHLISTLSAPISSNTVWTPARLMEEVHTRTQTGHPRLQTIYQSLLDRLHRLFLVHLRTFLLHGLAPSESTPISPALGLDMGPDPLSPTHRVYALNEELLPRSVDRGTRESMLYVGRVASTLKREGRALPEELLAGVREGISKVKGLEEGGGLDELVQRARAEVGEWLWKNVLTGPQILEAIETFGNYFLTRNAPLTHSFIDQLHTLINNKLLTSNPKSSSSIIREQDLQLALLRSSLGTSAEKDRSLDTIRFKLPTGPIRALPPTNTRTHRKNPTTQDISGVSDLFSSFVLGAPMLMTTRTTWPLDLFITPSTLSAYSEINSYLTALRDTHQRVLSTWTSLSAAQKDRRKYTGVTEGGTAEEIDARRELGRKAWGVIRIMLFWLDEIIGHFMVDIIDVQHRRLVEQLEGASVNTASNTTSAPASLRGSTRPTTPNTQIPPARSQFGEKTTPPTQSTYNGIPETGTVPSKAPPTPNKEKQEKQYLDFLTLRTMHTRHLSFLREGLLIADRELAVMIRDILETCRRFTGLVERWGGDVLPGLLEDDGDDGDQRMMAERTGAVQEIMLTMQEQLSDFFRALLETQNPTPGNVDASTATAVPGTSSFSRTARTIQMMRSGMMSRQVSFAGKTATNAKDRERDEKALEAEALMGKHIEQLLLRLDFNGVLTSWLNNEEEGIASKHILAEGGL